jgi:hypothetical protein
LFFFHLQPTQGKIFAGEFSFPPRLESNELANF